jgi:hypothetical protein
VVHKSKEKKKGSHGDEVKKKVGYILYYIIFFSVKGVMMKISGRTRR